MNTGPFLSHLHRFSDGSTRLKVIYFLLNIVLSRLRCQDKTTLRVLIFIFVITLTVLVLLAFSNCPIYD